MKVLILVLAENKQSHFIKAIEEIRNSYFKEYDERVVGKYFYIGDGEYTHIKDDLLICKIEESYGNILFKTQEAFKYCYENFEFDFIFRVNSGSYLNIKNLCDFLDTLDNKNILGGAIGNHNTINFVSGSGYIISKDLVGIIANENNLKNDMSIQNLIDDVALSNYFQTKHNVKLSEYHYRQDLFNYNNSDLFLENINKNKIQYYFRSSNYDLYKKIYNKLWN
jgi:hypothetical protein